jgi:hypothetical protein
MRCFAAATRRSLYAIQSFFLYCLLYQRIKAVESSFQAMSRSSLRIMFEWLIIFVKLGTATVPLLAVFGLFVFHGTLYFEEGKWLLLLLALYVHVRSHWCECVCVCNTCFAFVATPRYNNNTLLVRSYTTKSESIPLFN